MRAREFIVEYNQQLTLNNFRDQLIKRVARDDSGRSPRPEVVEKLEFLGPDGKWFKNPGFRDWIPTPEGQAEIRKSLDNILIRDVLLPFEDADPSKNKRFVPWMLQAYIADMIPKMEDVYDLATFLEEFEELRRRKRLPEGVPTDLRQIKDKSTYLAVEKKVSDEFEKVGKYPANQPQGEVDIKLDNEELTVAVPLDHAASCYYGFRTKWCTAKTKDPDTYAGYVEHDNDLIMFIPKEPIRKREKYQLYIGNDNSNYSFQLMDEEDQSVDLRDLMKRFNTLTPKVIASLDRHGVLRNWVLLKPQQFKQYIEAVLPVVQQITMEYATNIEANDDYYIEYLTKNGYQDEDGDIDWDRVENDGEGYFNFNTDLRDAVEGVEEDLKNLTPEQFDEFVNNFDGEPGEVNNYTIEYLGRWLSANKDPLPPGKTTSEVAGYYNIIGNRIVKDIDTMWKHDNGKSWVEVEV